MAVALRSSTTAQANPGPSLTLPTPSGLAAGDLLLVVIQANGFPGAWATVPAGWTSLGLRNTTDTGEAWWKIATGSETATDFTFVGGGGTQFSGTCACFSGVDGTTPVEASATANLASGTTYTSPSVTSLSANAMLVQLWGADLNASSSLTAVTAGLAIAGQLTQSSTFILSGITYKLEPTAGAHTYQVSHGAAAIGAQGWAVSLKPAASGITAAIARATETDTATALGRAKTRAAAAALEADSALPVGRAKARAIATAPAEVDTAVAFGRAKVRVLGQVLEADVARPLARVKTRPLGSAGEADAAQAIGRTMSRPISVATETDVAPSFGRAKARAIAAALETDQARPMAAPPDEDLENTSRRALLLIGG